MLAVVPNTLGINYSQPVNKAWPLNRGLVAWWLALPQWSGGRTWYDLMGLNPGTLTNMTSATLSGWENTTRPGGYQQMLFDGVDDYVDVPNAPVLSVPIPFSIAFWFRTTQTGNKVIFEKDGNNGYSVQRGLSNELRINVGGGSSGTNFFNTTATFNDGLWHHAAFVMSAINSGAIYVDGVSQTLANNNPSTPVYSTGELYFGGRATVVPYAGSLDDLRLAKVAYSARDAFSLYNESRQGYPTGLNRVAWPMVGASASVSPLFSFWDF